MNASRFSAVVVLMVLLGLAVAAISVHYRREERPVIHQVPRAVSLCSVWESPEAYFNRPILTEGDVVFLEHGWAMVDPHCGEAQFHPRFPVVGAPGQKKLERDWRSQSVYDVHAEVIGELIPVKSKSFFHHWLHGNGEGTVRERIFQIDQVISVEPR